RGPVRGRAVVLLVAQRVTAALGRCHERAVLRPPVAVELLGLHPRLAPHEADELDHAGSSFSLDAGSRPCTASVTERVAARRRSACSGTCSAVSWWRKPIRVRASATRPSAPKTGAAMWLSRYDAER